MLYLPHLKHHCNVSLLLAQSVLSISLHLQLMAALSNPKVMAAMQGMMSGGAPDMAKIQELMSDPEVGPAMQKVSM